MNDGTSVAALDTIWDVPDGLWRRMEPILDAYYELSGRGRPHVPWRPVVDGIIYRMRTGGQWNQMPERYGSDRTVHRWFQRWNKDGVWECLWAILLNKCDELGAVNWTWQSADAVLGKARFGGPKTGRNPTDRGKSGTKKSLAVEAAGGPTAVVLAGANEPDMKLLEATLNAVVVERPDPDEYEQNLCLDKGYDYDACRQAAEAAGYIHHIRRRGEETIDPNDPRKRRPARRWVVERTIAWLQKCRGILIRYDKKDTNYLGLVQLACALLWYRRLDKANRLLAGETPAPEF